MVIGKLENKKPMIRKAKSNTDLPPHVFSFNKGKTSLGVNSLGEIYRNREYISCSTVDINALAGKLGRHPNDADVQNEFDAQYAEMLTAFEYGVVQAVGVLQSLNSGFARVWGGAIDRKMIINMSVEFIAFDDDKKAWPLLEAWGKKHKGFCNIMDHAPHLDKFKKQGAKRWQYGKDHGRMETHIEFIWNVTHMSKPQVQALMEKLRADVGDLWSNYGNAVI